MRAAFAGIDLTSRRLLGAWLALALLAGCQGGHPLAAADGAANSCADPYAQSSQPNDPCGVDEDCHNGFLTCVRSSVTVCRDADFDAGAADATCPGAVAADDVPVCPETATVPLSLCSARYQIPCTTDKDCGPAGFTCTSGQCQEQAGDVCTTAATCPEAWECYAPCPCGNAVATKHCNPPFAAFACPACPASPEN